MTLPGPSAHGVHGGIALRAECFSEQTCLGSIEKSYPRPTAGGPGSLLEVGMRFSRRDAKRLACWIAATELREREIDHVYYDALLKRGLIVGDGCDADHERVLRLYAANEELVGELERRGAQ